MQALQTFQKIHADRKISVPFLELLQQVSDRFDKDVEFGLEYLRPGVDRFDTDAPFFPVYQ